MIRTLRTAWRLLRAVVHGLHGLGLVLTRFPALGAAQRQPYIQWWATKMLRMMGIALHVEGTPHAGGTLLVANHISWLDIMAVHAVCPQARFVSKADVRSWPVLSKLVDSAGTLYLERERKRDALRVVHTMARALAAGETVAVFPEGTTSDGRALLPFHANLLQAAISTGTLIQPVALRFSDAHGAVSAAVEFVGDTTLLESLWRVAGGDGVVARIRLLPPLPSAGADRRMLAESLRGRIGAALDQALP
jgi:1-acyl-sn-glycerol-3-phosphate acyltransferase